MRNLAITLVTALSLIALPAYADRGGAYRHGGGYGHGYSGHHHGGAPWAGLAVVGALTGLAIVAAQRRPVYVEPYPAPVYAPPAGPAYYCQSSAMYYPHTTACPEGWLAVPGGRY
jgi:hypothetical protein